MSSTAVSNTPRQTGPNPRPARAARRTLPAGFAFYLQASIVLFFLAGSSAPTPLYAVYSADWGFSPITVTVVFGIYALAVLAALLAFGSLSDYVGRRPVLLVAIAMQVAAMIIFVTADGVPALLAARIVQGLSTGAAVGALGAGMLDIDRGKATIANAVAPMAGTASGALISALLVQFLPAPTHLVYLVLLGVFVLQGIGVLLMAESATPRAGALASLRPRIGLPASARRPMLAAVPALVAVWALAGFYGSIGPSLVRLLAGSNSVVLGGSALFVLAGAGALTVLAVRNLAPRAMMTLGAVALLIGLAITLVAIGQTSTPVFFLGTTVAGIGFGAGFPGALRTVLPLAAPHERAGVLSILYVVAYLAMGLPAVIAGFLVVHTGVLSTAREYGTAVMVLAVAALIGLAISRERAPELPAPEPERVPSSASAQLLAGVS